MGRRGVGGGPKGLHIKQVDDPLVRLAALAEELQLLSVEDKVPSLDVGRTGRPLLRFGPLSQVQPRDSPTHPTPFALTRQALQHGAGVEVRDFKNRSSTTISVLWGRHFWHF